jgi:hypothetical protein
MKLSGRDGWARDEGEDERISEGIADLLDGRGQSWAHDGNGGGPLHVTADCHEY